MVGSVTEIPERTSTTEQTKDTLQKIPHCNRGILYAGYSGGEIQQKNLEFTAYFHLRLHLQFKTTVVLSTIVTDPTARATSYYYVTLQRVGKIRKQSACIAIKTGKRSLM